MYSQFNLKQKKRMVRCLLFALFLLVYSLLSISAYCINKHAVSAFSVHIQGVPSGNVTVDVFSLLGNKEYPAIEKKPGVFSRGPEYLSGFQIQLHENDFEKIKAIQVRIGENLYDIEKGRLDDFFSVVRCEGRVVLQSGAWLIPNRSHLPFLNQCITWKGDFQVVGVAFLRYLTILVCLFIPLGIVKKLTDEDGKFRQWIDSHNGRIITFLLVAAGVLSFFYIGRIYHVNDDTAILDSIKCGLPVSFMGVSLGWTLSSLYHFLPVKIEWYGWLLYLSNIAALLIVIRRTSTLIKDRILFLCVTMVLISMFMFSLTELTFTISSILLGGAAVYAFLSLISQDKISIVQSVGLGASLALGYLIRTNSLAALTVFFGPVVAYILFKYRNKLLVRRNTLSLLLFGIPLIAVIFIEAVVVPATDFDQNQHFKEYNRIRGKLHDYPVLSENLNNVVLLKKNNWSENDYLMFENWMFFDESKFTLDRIRNILKIPPQESKDIRLFDVIKKIRAIARGERLFLLFILSFMLLPAAKSAGCAGRRIVLLLFLTYILTGAVAMSFFLRFPQRIAYPLFVLSVVFGMLIIFRPGKDGLTSISSRKYQFFLIIGFTIFLLNMSGAILLKGALSERKQRLEYTVDLAENAYPGKVLVYHPCCLNLHHVDPLFPAVKNGGVAWFSAGGWPTFSPIFYQHLREIGLSQGRDLFVGLYTDWNIYFLGTDGYAALLLQYLCENFDSCVIIHSRRELGDGTTLFQFARQALSTGGSRCEIYDNDARK